ncbi:MAG: DUF4870 domain-containing protein [Candidatus Omnitrophica bacterium]|nr:DUF4870 domain-containing protein [Candidatus Omnitrophota bacterium]MBU1128314.1 DUF4870 domain-containing protein [Candidatus Omnitrophota bacterium]MBU1657281.1 DUF4870 domain-containing protein [Candidatus Omnitrophota bacterium]MBU1784150.1 DUF4870 domain-containing protein [Candidatus Omnitrophota bacterium]MBU1851265.1 DUF4870 domain-containing protein [Candidatus Omnitrophota bacterium]
MGKTTTGINPAMSGLLCYLGGFVTGIIFYVVEKENKFVRFHAVQSIVVFGGLFVINLALGFILPWVLSGIVSILMGLLSFVLWIVLMVKAYQGEMFKLPVAGEVAEKHA